MKKILFIVGPTATGKTALAIKLAKKFNGELISADSRQVYKGMDIITGKDLKNISMVDVCPPDREFNVALFQKLATKVILDIQKRGKIPIVVGGTGFYIKALQQQIGTLGIKPDWNLRKKLENKSVIYLQKNLKKLWPERWEGMNISDRANPRRLIRAIEVANNKGDLKKDNNIEKMDCLYIGLKVDKDILRRKIEMRVKERIKKGAEKEAKYLFKLYPDNKLLKTTIGYREWFKYLNREINRETLINDWIKAEVDYAKRQMVWFKKQKHIIWIEPENVESEVISWYDKTNAKEN